MTSSRKTKLFVFSGLSSLFGAFFLGLTFTPYPTLKSLADRLVADGDLESFSPQLAQALRIPWGVAGAALMFAAAWSMLYPESFSRLLSFLRLRFANWLRDLERFAVDLRLLRLSREELAAVAAICALGVGARVMLINRSIEYDEAYTVMAFAHSPFRILLSDYHVPNNHIFHTILVRIAVLLLGSQPWQVRIPAMLAGTLLIPFVFWLGRQLYSKNVGYLSAAIVAFLPNMVGRSVSARGYIIVTLLTVMGFLLGSYLVRHRNLFAWSLFVGLCALGFYTVPIMLYPFGCLILWMLMSARFRDGSQYTLSVWALHLLFVGIMVVLLSLLLYSPVLLNPGAESIVANNRVLQSQSLEAFLDGLPVLASNVIAEWTFRLPPVWRGMFLVGSLLSVLAADGRRSQHVHTGLAILPGVFLLLLTQRPYPLSRIWLWVIPFAAIWVSAGLGNLLQLIPRNRVGRSLSAILLVSVLVGLGATGIQSSRQRVIDNDVENPAAEDVARFLAPLLTPNSLVVLSYNSDAYIWYYLYLHGVARPRIFNPNKDRPFEEVFAIVRTQADNCDDRKVIETLTDYGPDLSLLNLDKTSEVAQIDYMKICWIPAQEQ